MEPQREVPTYMQGNEFLSTRNLPPQFVRGESIPPGLHIYGYTVGNEKGRWDQEYIEGGNQDRLIYAVAEGVTIAGVADEGQGADSVDMLGQLLTDPNLRQRLVSASPAERESIIRTQLGSYSREYCNTGFAFAVGRAISGGYEVEVYSAGNVAAFVNEARGDYSQSRMVNSPVFNGEERTNLYQGFNARDPLEVERSIVRLAKGDILVLVSDGVQAMGTDRVGYFLPRYSGGSLELYSKQIVAGSSKITFGQGRDIGFDDRTVMAFRVR